MVPPEGDWCGKGKAMFINEKEAFAELEERIGYRFQNHKLLKQALTHKSFTNEQKVNKGKCYERMEFLGDAVLELITSEFLYKEYPEVPEGILTKMRASTVCEMSLAFCARKFGLEQFIFLGKGEEATGGRDRDSIISDIMEASIGAVYLDGGLEEARKYVQRFILDDLEENQLFYDSKSQLQETVQGVMKKEYRYRVMDEYGPEHDKTYVVEVFVDEESIGKGCGRTKKAAEQQAAYQALLLLREKGYVFKKY